MELDWQALGTAFALMFIFEGVTPFIMPSRLRGMALMLINMQDRSIRRMGFFSMMIGLVLLSLLRSS
ncbi:MAG TPA: DUF2065 domain-containing protein [Pseudomonadales bacterium]|nr:DUF2065 domain-containing protein [Pseudomonadales bacterium]